MDKIRNREKDFFNNLIDEMPVFFVAINKDGTTRYVNKKMLNSLGYQEQDVFQQDYLKQFVPPRQHDMLQNIFLSLQKQGKPTYNNNLILTKEGKELWVRWYGHPIYNDSGDFQYLIGIGIDVTAERKSESELNKQLKINQLLLKTIPVGIAFIDKFGKITYANEQAEKILRLNVGKVKEGKYNDPLWKITDLEGKPLPEEKLPFYLVKKYLQPFYGIELAIKWSDGKRIFLSVNATPILDEKDIFQGAVCSLSDITEQKIKEKEREQLYFLEREHSNLIAMENEMTYNLISGKNFSSKLKQVLGFISRLLPHDGSDISILENNQLEVIAIHGYRGLNFQNIVKNLRIDVDDYDIEREAIQSKKPVIVSDTSIDSRWVMITGLEWIRSAIKIPFIFEGEVLGTLGIVSEKTNAFNQESIKHIESFIHGLSIAIHNYLSYKQLHKTRNEIIFTITKLVEIRDPYTFGHQEGVANLATAIAKEMGMKEEAIEMIRIASLVHDIGKVTIPSEILNKPGKLSEMEYNLVKDHSKSGYEILKDISFTYPIAEIVYQHHEKINGTGYPRGLKGDQIMLEARIIAVADIYEAMSSHRPYRPALGFEAAEEELKNNKGILYDPQVVDACLKVGQKTLTRLSLS